MWPGTKKSVGFTTERHIRRNRNLFHSVSHMRKKRNSPARTFSSWHHDKKHEMQTQKRLTHFSNMEKKLPQRKNVLVVFRHEQNFWNLKRFSWASYQICSPPEHFKMWSDKNPFTCPSGLPYWYHSHHTAVDCWLWDVIRFLIVSAVWQQKTDVFKDTNTRSWCASSHRTVIIHPVCLEKHGCW